MRRAAVVLIGIALLVAGAFAYAIGDALLHPNPVRSPGGSSESARVAGPQETLDRPAGRPHGTSDSNAGAPRLGERFAPMDRAGSTALAEQAANTLRLRAARIEKLSKAYAAERREAEWAGKAESELRGVVKSLDATGLMSGTRIEIECRTSICRVEGTYPTAEAQRVLSDGVRSSFFGSGEVRRFEEGGKLRSTAFIFRQGFQVPQ